MKKLMSFLAIAGFIFVIGCGPSAEEKAATEKAKQDSIAAVVQKAVEDSMAAVQAATQKAMEDSINAAKMKAMEDSMNNMKQAAVEKVKVKPKSTPKSDNSSSDKPKTLEQMIKEAKEKGKK